MLLNNGNEINFIIFVDNENIYINGNLFDILIYEVPLKEINYVIPNKANRDVMANYPLIGSLCNISKEILKPYLINNDYKIALKYYVLEKCIDIECRYGTPIINKMTMNNRTAMIRKYLKQIHIIDEFVNQNLIYDEYDNYYGDFGSSDNDIVIDS